MNARFDLVFCCDARQDRAVADVTVIKRHVLIYSGAVAAPEIIENYNLFAFCSQSVSRHAPDVSSSACHQNWHLSPFFPAAPESS